MTDSYQREIPKARVNISLDLHTGGARKRVELPLKLLVMGDYSAGQARAALADRAKVEVHRDNFDAVLADFHPGANFSVANALAGDGSELPVSLSFRAMRDFEPEAVARQLPALRALIAMRNLLRDLKANLLDNATFRRELELILKDESLTRRLRAELEALTAGQQP